MFGAALLLAAPATAYPPAFQILGGAILGTAVVLLLVPWRWHHRFAQWAIPLVLRHLWLYAAAAGLLGCAVLYGAVSPVWF